MIKFENVERLSQGKKVVAIITAPLYWWSEFELHGMGK
jgi:hypothetical protein